MKEPSASDVIWDIVLCVDNVREFEICLGTSKIVGLEARDLN